MPTRPPPCCYTSAGMAPGAHRLPAGGRCDARGKPLRCSLLRCALPCSAAVCGASPCVHPGRAALLAPCVHCPACALRQQIAPSWAHACPAPPAADPRCPLPLLPARSPRSCGARAGCTTACAWWPPRSSSRTCCCPGRCAPLACARASWPRQRGLKQCAAGLRRCVTPLPPLCTAGLRRRVPHLLPPCSASRACCAASSPSCAVGPEALLGRAAGCRPGERRPGLAVRGWLHGR